MLIKFTSQRFSAEEHNFFTHKYVAKTSDLSRVFSTGYVVRVAKYRIIIDSKLINSVTKSYFAKGKSDGPVCRVSEIFGFWVCTLKKWIENDLFFKNPCSNIV